MLIRILLCLCLTVFILVIIAANCTDKLEFVTYYQKNIRASLFSGFLTLGGFLLSLKTFIVVKLKESVYDNPHYKERFNARKKLDSSLEIYAPLRRLSDFLFWTILVAIVAAAGQFTLGLSLSFYAMLAAVGLALMALFMLICALLLVKQCLKDWFDFISSAA